MANRNTLAAISLDNFRDWLIKDGWTLEPTKGIYEVLRARKEGRNRPLIVWRRDSNNGGAELTHLTIDDRDSGVISSYIRRTDNYV